jgi:uncharacterized protein
MTAVETAEPTMEEILASIRKIISDEQTVPSVDATQPALMAQRSELVADEVPEPAPQVPTPQVTARNSFRPSTDVLELTDSVEQRLRMPAAPAPSLISAEAEDVATAKMSALADMMTRNYPGSENTLEGLVQEMLRPMLKTWLDQNLPDMVEAIVTREIARISGRAR